MINTVLSLKQPYHRHAEADFPFFCQDWASAADYVALELRKAMGPLCKMQDRFRVDFLPSIDGSEERGDPCVYCISDMAAWRAEFVWKRKNLQKLSAFLP